MKDNTTTNVQLENGSPAFAKPVLPAVPSAEKIDFTQHKSRLD